MRNLNDLWDTAAREFTDRPAVHHLDSTYTYGDLDLLIQAFAIHLRERLGIHPGDRIALVMPNCLHSVVCYLGAIRAGAVALPINIRLKPAEMQFILQDAAPRAAVVHGAVWPTVREALAGLEQQPALVGIETAGEELLPVEDLLGSVGSMGSGGKPDSPHSPYSPYTPTPDDVAAIIYTSGTTGRPKGAMITHGNVLFNVQATLAGHGFRPDDTHILVVPLFHVTGLNTIMPTAFTQGATLVVTARTAPTDILGLVERHRATTFFAVPTTMILLVQTRGIEKFDLSSLRLVAYSGAPMPVRSIHQLRALLPHVRLHNFFGLTETTSCTTVLPDEQALLRPESIGRPVPGLELKVVDDAGATLTAGQVG